MLLHILQCFTWKLRAETLDCSPFLLSVASSPEAEATVSEPVLLVLVTVPEPLDLEVPAPLTDPAPVLTPPSAPLGMG